MQINKKDVYISSDKIISKYHLTFLNKDKVKKEGKIYKSSIYRLGLELSGAVAVNDKIQNMVGWGTVERKWFASLPEADLEKKLRHIFKYQPPLVLLSIGFTEEMAQKVSDIASEYDIPVAKSDDHLSHLISIIGPYLAEKFSEKETVHGSAIIVNGIGVMLIGKSGIGKSEAILELIQKKHIFVSDDSVIISRLGNYFIGRPTHITQNMLEVRGIGILDVKHIYGSALCKHKLYIDLVIELLPNANNENNFDRLGNADLEYEILGGSIKKIQIPVQPGRNTSSLIEAAVNWYISYKEDVNPLKIINQRMQNQ
ncbi:HPr(Ser) kinase/phosphatase [Candidatus Mycoplasma pogonae]